MNLSPIIEKILIPFNRPFLTGEEQLYLDDASNRGQLAGNGFYTQQCCAWLENNLNTYKALLTHSCTAALEMAAILIDIQPGDEVIMPSYTFVSTANAFVLRGGVPVFVDIRSDNLNINYSLIEAAITPKTKAIVVVHYAGVSCDMDAIMEIAGSHKLLVVEDAAQAIMSEYKGRKLGSIGHIGCLSFHETKNIIAGEGGAILINCPNMVDRAEIIWEKGTNRNEFNRNKVDKYRWLDIGSSFAPSEVTAAFLWAQLKQALSINHRRIKLWETYHQSFATLESRNKLKRPIVSADNVHNAHMYFLLLNNQLERDKLMNGLRGYGINSVTHYVPLHNSPAGLVYGRCHGSLKITDRVADSLLRLPLWIGLEGEKQKAVITAVEVLLS